MLTPDTRTVLLDDLTAPSGFEVDAVVTTTFTLDLTAAMLPPFAIAGMGISSARTDPITLLQALRRAGDKVDIFCQAGSISVPRSSDLVAFLEPMVHQVVPPAGTLFHPKIWVLRFTAPDESPRYRLLVLSRNLTHDNTWDIAVRLDSEALSEEPLAQNAPLAALLRWLPDSTRDLSEERRERVLGLAEQITHVHWERPADVQEISFHTGGVPGQPVVDLHAGRHLVISPFVTAEGLGLSTAGRNQPAFLVSRQETLDALAPEDLEGITAFTMAADTEVPEAETLEVEEEGFEAQAASALRGLHAKVYVLEPTDRWGKARVLMGSSNSTGPGLTRNIEFLVEVLGRRARLGIDQVLPADGSSTDGIRPLLEPYVRQEPEDREEERTRRRLQRDLRDLAAIDHTITIRPEGSGPPATYSATVGAATPYPLRENVRIEIGLLTRPGSSVRVGATPDLTVGGLELADITPCITMTATHGDISESTVLLGRLIDCPEGRLDAVIASQVNDKEKFSRLLFLLLSLGNPAELAALLANQGAGEGDGGFFTTGSKGILELVLRGLGTRSDGIADLDRIMGAVDPEVFPDGFEKFWNEVRRARRILERGER